MLLIILVTLVMLKNCAAKLATIKGRILLELYITPCSLVLSAEIISNIFSKKPDLVEGISQSLTASANSAVALVEQTSQRET